MKIPPLLIIGALAALFFKKDSSSAPANKKPLITSKFGSRINPVTGKKEFHNGIDLALPINTPLKALGDSTVVKVWNNALGGNQLSYKLKNGFTMGYAHLNKVSVKAGQAVKKNQLLALSGNTGKTTGPHLHVTLRNAAGNYIDPSPYFKTL